MTKAGRFTEAMLNEPITNHVRTDVATLRPGWTVDEALVHMRANPPAGRVIYFYVTDDDGKLLGVVPTRRLLLSAPTAPIAGVMIRGAVAVPADATVLEACEFFTLHRFLAFPVVDADKRLVGIVDVELYTDELAELADEHHHPPGLRDEVFQLIGVHLTEKAAGQPVKAAAGRFPWLLCNIAGGLLAAFLSGLFDDVLTLKNAAYALFIPVVLALSESVAIQSVTLALEGLRSGKKTLRQLAKRGLAEGGVGLLLGAGSAGVIAGVAAVWLQDAAVAGVLLATIGLGVTASALIGFTVPTVLHLLNKNPGVAAGPVSLASADLVTLLMYFNFGRMFG